MTVQIDTTAENNGVRLVKQGSHPSAPATGHVILYYITGTAQPGLFIEDVNGNRVGPFITGSGSTTDYSSLSSITGWGSPSKEILIYKNGRFNDVQFYISGTSNSTAVSFTVPDTPTNGFMIVCVQVIDNGAGQSSPGRVEITKGSTTINLSKTPDGNAFTNSGLKIVRSSFTYISDT